MTFLRPASAVALALLSLCLAPIALAAPAIPLPWSAGTKLEYRSTTVDEKVANGVRRVATTRALTTVEITQAGETGFVQSWRDTGGTVELEGDGPDLAAEQAVATAMLRRFEGVALEADLDAQGLFTGVRNWRALGALMREALLPALRTQAKARAAQMQVAVTDAEVDARLAPVLQRMTTQSVLDASLGKQASIYNLFTAPAITAGKPVRYEDELQSPVSSHRIPAIGQFELIRTDAAADTVTLRWTQSIDPVKGLEATWKMVEALTGAALPADRSQLPTGLVLRDEATVTVHRGSGVPRHLVHQRRLELGGQVKTTTWTLAQRTTPGQ
jgi:hypothetical protein